jgi:1-phosphofructokinase
MIVTLTPNPSVDRTVFLDDLALGSVNRSQRSWSEPSGKGVNVALALHAHGVDVRAVVTAGGPVGAQLRQMLDTTGLDTVIVPIAGEMVALGRRHGVPVAVDTSGPALAESLSAGPDLVKPNLHELAELTGTVPTTLGEVIDAAQQVRRRGARTVLASLGGDGAVLVDADGALWGRAPVAKVVSTVGAGDAMLAGYLSCRGNRTEALATALQWGAAAVQHEGTLFSPNTSHTPVTVTDAVDLTQALHDHDPTISAATAAAQRIHS